MPYDDDQNLNSDLTPSFDDFERIIASKLQSYIDFLKKDPPLSEIDRKADKIIDTMLNATGLSKVINLLVDLLAHVYVPLERLGLWNQWNDHLFQILPPIADNAEDKLSVWYESLITHFQYKGNASRYREVMSFLREIIHLDENRPVEEHISALATQIDVYNANAPNLDLAHEAIRVARQLENRWLEGRVYSVLGVIYANNLNPWRSFEYGQMAYCFGSAIGNDILVTNGLHLMALGCQFGGHKERTYEYLTLATASCDRSGDVPRRAYLQLTWASSYLQFGDYLLAERYGKEAMGKFKSGNWYYASAVYTYGIALYSQGKYTEAKPLLLTARHEYEIIGATFNRYMADHALACLFDKVGQSDEAARRCETLLQASEELKTSDTRFDYLIGVIRSDLEKFRTKAAYRE